MICPDTPRHEGDLVGCGLEFEATPDKEGLVDCPGCGMWHTPAMETHNRRELSNV